MKNEAEKPGHDSQDENMVAGRRTVKQPQKALKISEFVDTDSSTKDEQEPAVKQPQKASKPQGLLIQTQVLRMNKNLP